MESKALVQQTKEKTWKKLEKCVETLVESGEALVVLRYNRKTRAVDFRGSNSMKSFIEGKGIFEEFIESASKRNIVTNQMAVIPVGLPNMDPEDINVCNLRKIVTDLVGTYVLSRDFIDENMAESVFNLHTMMNCEDQLWSDYQHFQTFHKLQNKSLESIFINYPLMGMHYLTFVIMKETIIGLNSLISWWHRCIQGDARGGRDWLMSSDN